MYRTMTSSINIFFRTCPLSQPCIGGFVLSEKTPYGGFMWLYTQTMVIHPSPWLYQSFFSICVNILLGKTQRWLYVPYRGYTSHIVVMRGYTWLYTYCKCNEKSQNHVMTTKVVRPSSWRQQLVGNAPYGGFMWLYVTSRGYTPPVRGYTTHCSPDAATSY